MHHSTCAVLLCAVIAVVLHRVLAALGDRYAYERVLPEPRTCIQDGCIQGRYFDGLEGDQYEGYLGVPFAKPPVGRLRFKNPVRNDPWNGDYDATWERSRCMQKNDLRPNQAVQGSEDCLYLNVFRPRNVTGPLPVLFYIHGGGYASGSNSMAEFGPERFMDMKKVILVIPQYRLGVFGFLSTEDRISPGNYGLKDQLFALKWTQRNIAYFGGDPKLVTIVGQSAGGSSVQYHMLSPQSKGLFARAISMSGSALGFWNHNVNHLVLARRQAEVVGIRNVEVMTTQQIVEALRQVDGIVLAKSIDKLKYFYVHDLTLFHPTVERYVDDETFIREDPRDLWAAGRYHQVPYTMGFVPNEAAFASAILLTNSTLLNELNENSSNYIPRIIGVYHPTSVQMLKDRFFPDGTNQRWLTEKNVGNLQDMFSEAFIKHGIELSVKQVISSKTQTLPLSVYYFNFKGPYSHSYYYTYTNGDFGVVHIDDLMYLFRSSGLYPDFAPGTPAWYTSKVFVDYFINIAYDGIVGPPCTAESCELLEFTNYNATDSPGYLNVSDEFDEEKFAFWYNLYAMQSY